MKKIIIFIYLVIQFILYLFSVYFETLIPRYIACYLIIVINLIMSLYLLYYHRNKVVVLNILGLFFTLISDTFLVIYDSHYLIALFFFSFVHILYFIKIKVVTKEYRIKLIDIFRFISIIIAFVLVIIITYNNFDLLYLVAAFYFLMLLFNFIYCIKIYKTNKLMTIGLLLFIFCDIFVGLNFIKEILLLDSLPFLNFLLNGWFNTIWFFYAPSQVLLTLAIEYDN